MLPARSRTEPRRLPRLSAAPSPAVSSPQDASRGKGAPGKPSGQDAILSSSASFLSPGRASLPPPSARHSSLTLSPTLPAMRQTHGHGSRPPSPALCAGPRCCSPGASIPPDPPSPSASGILPRPRNAQVSAGGRTAVFGGHSQRADVAHSSRGTRVGHSSLRFGVWGSPPAGCDPPQSPAGKVSGTPWCGAALPSASLRRRGTAMAGAGAVHRGAMHQEMGSGGTGLLPWGDRAGLCTGTRASRGSPHYRAAPQPPD